MTSSISRTVDRVLDAPQQSEGVGAKVRRSIGTRQLRHISPFIMLDHFWIGKGAGFADHPHRGQATITYMLAGGKVEHEDFLGNRGQLDVGDLQWMQAGKGVVHAEMPVHEVGKPDPQGMQLWVDLPAATKLRDPQYMELRASEVPEVIDTAAGLHVKIISGTFRGVSSSVRPWGGAWYFDIRLRKPENGDALAKVWMDIPKGWNAFIYTIGGRISIPDKSGRKTIPTYHIATLSNASGDEANGIDIQQEEGHDQQVDDNVCSGGESRFILVAGEPLDQEIVQYGPFVMDTEEGIQQAFLDYRLHKGGFERAATFQSEIAKSLR